MFPRDMKRQTMRSLGVTLAKAFAWNAGGMMPMLL